MMGPLVNPEEQMVINAINEIYGLELFSEMSPELHGAALVLTWRSQLVLKFGVGGPQYNEYSMKIICPYISPPDPIKIIEEAESFARIFYPTPPKEPHPAAMREKVHTELYGSIMSSVSGNQVLSVETAEFLLSIPQIAPTNDSHYHQLRDKFAKVSDSVILELMEVGRMVFELDTEKETLIIHLSTPSFVSEFQDSTTLILEHPLIDTLVFRFDRIQYLWLSMGYSTECAPSTYDTPMQSNHWPKYPFVLKEHPWVSTGYQSKSQDAVDALTGALETVPTAGKKATDVFKKLGASLPDAIKNGHFHMPTKSTELIQALAKVNKSSSVQPTDTKGKIAPDSMSDAYHKLMASQTLTAEVDVETFVMGEMFVDTATLEEVDVVESESKSDFDPDDYIN